MNNEIQKDGNWALTSCLGFGHGYYIRHMCRGTAQYGKAWCDYSYFKHPCPLCKEYVPEGLQAMFVFLTGHMEDIL